MNTKHILLSIGLTGLLGCVSNLEKHGRHFREFGDLKSLQEATHLIELGTDTATVKKILGEPMDFGFDIRYYTDSVGKSGSPLGAVFGVDEKGKVSWRNVFEIGE